MKKSTSILALLVAGAIGFTLGIIFTLAFPAFGNIANANTTPVSSECISQPSISPSSNITQSSNDSTPSESISDNNSNSVDFTSKELQVAQKYLELYESGEWKGFTQYDFESGLEISEDWGVICINGKETNFKTDKRVLYDKAAALYMSGNWDGLPFMLDGKTIELSPNGGYILSDGKILLHQGNLDLPDDFDYENCTSNCQYVPGNGTFAIINQHLIKFIRGEKVDLPGGNLNWLGVQGTMEEINNLTFDEYFNGNYSFNTPYLFWNEPNQKLYLKTADKDEPLFDGNYYLYVFPDINSSQIQYVGMVSGKDIPIGESWSSYDITTLIK